MNVLQALVKMEEHVLMALVNTHADVHQVMKEPTVKSVSIKAQNSCVLRRD